MPSKLTSPVRIQLSRKAGFNLQIESSKLNGLTCVVVSRPSKWGNPFKVTPEPVPMGCTTAARAVGKFHTEMLYALSAIKPIGGLGRPGFNPPFIWMAENLDKIAGKNLACFCPLNQPCHADVLLRLANPGVKP